MINEKVNSSKFKTYFHTKPHMIPRDQVQEITGFQPGGVCPFAVPEDIPIWLDVSMKRFEYVHPAGGNEYTSFRNALVRANYTNIKEGIYETTEFLELFLRNLLLSEKMNYIIVRCMLVENFYWVMMTQ